MIVITLKEARAQPNKPTPTLADAEEVSFRFEASRVPFTQTSIVSDKELMGDAQPKIKIKQAADGSGTMVAMVVRTATDFDIETNAVGIDVVKVGEEPGDLYFVFTAVGTMLGKSQITLDIPEGWTAPLKGDGSDAGDILIEGTAADDNKIMRDNNNEISEIIGRTAIATVMEDANLAPDDTVIFRYKTPTAPTAAAAYTFTAKSKSQEEGSPMVLSEGSPVITVSPPGNGSGAMVLDTTSAAAAQAGVVIKFTFTAAEAMSGGEVRVELPSTWSAAKDNIKDEADTANRVTFRDPARVNDVSYVASFVDNDRTIVIPVASLGIRNQIIFTYTGTVQNTAGTAIIITSTRTSNTGTPVPIATPPRFTVNNAMKGTGDVAYLSGPIASASSGNQLTFDFKAVGTMNGGAVSMEVPPDWSPPRLTQGVAGYTSALTPAGGSVGQLSVSETSDRVVIVPINTLGPDQIVKIIYGRGSGSSGAVAQENAGGGTFIFKTKGSSGDDFESIGNQPTVLVTNAPDGSGTMTVAPTSVTAGSIVELVFTYMPAGTINGGKLQLTVPDGWTAPLGTAGRGFTTPETDPGVALGTLSFSDQSVTVPITALTVGQTIRIKYGSGGGSNGVVVPPETGDNTFVVRSQGLTDTQGGQLIELFAAPPVVSVTPAGDGSGTATVTAAAAVTAGSTGNSITIVYTAAGPMLDGAVSVDIADGWSPPDGKTSVSSMGTIGDPTFVGQTVVVEGVSLSANQTITFVYSDATAQGDAGDAVFAVKSQGTDAGTLTALETVAQSALTIVVGNAADGSGTLTIAPNIIAEGGGTLNITLTYTTVGTITSGGLRIRIPDDWTDPQITDSSGPGFVSAATVTGAVNVPTVGGRLISVFISSLGPNGTIDVSYNSATGTSEVGTSTFSAESRGSAPGSFQPLASSPTITRTSPASTFVISSGPESTFKGQASDAIVIETRDTDGSSRSASASAVMVSLSSSSSTGMFEDESGTVITSTSIPVGTTSVSVFYKDTVVGTATLTVTMTLLGETQMATHMITIAETASQLAISSAGEFFAGDALMFTIESQDASGNVAPSISDVTVTLASSSVTGIFEQNGNAVISVTILANETSATASYKDTTVGMATLTASATDLTDSPPHEVMVNTLLTRVESSSSSVMVGGTVTITAIGRPGQTATFSIGDDPDSIFPQHQMMAESTDMPGTYTGVFSPVVDLHPEGMYDVTVIIGDASLMLPGGLMIDNTDPVLTEAMADPTTIKNGQTLTFTAKSAESGLTVWIDGVSALDSMAADDRFDLVESAMEAGTYSYSAALVISEGNTAENGSQTLMAKATDAAGNAAVELPVVVELRNFFEFSLTVPRDISLIHIPLDVNEVDGEAMALDTVGDLFDALGGTANVSLLITRDTAASKWSSYLGDQSAGKSADRTITDDMGIITVMRNPVTLSLRGDALGTESDTESASFVSAINISRGLNLVGVPLKDTRVGKVSDLLSLEGIQGKVSSIIVSNGGAFKVIARPEDDGDMDVTGGQSFILSAGEAGTVEITGEAWDNISGSVATAPPMALVGHKIDGQTPVLEVHGAVIDEIANAAQDGFRVTVKNLSTSSSLNVLSSGDPADTSEGLYSVTFVDTDSSRAARAGDILEITVQTVSPYIGIEPIRHVVTTKDVELSRIRLVDLVTYEIPKETELLPNYPNPFNPDTWIPYRLAEDSSVTLTIYDTSGKVVRTIEIGHKPAAVYESRDKAVHWDGRNNYGERVASGIYFYSLSAVNFSATRKMVILK
jgi:hypothetical protein